MKTITSKCWAFSQEPGRNAKDVLFGSGFVPYDAYAVAACVDGSVITESVECSVRVEIQGELGRGMMALDFLGKLKSHRVFVMKTCNLTKFSSMLMASLQQPWGITARLEQFSGRRFHILLIHFGFWGKILKVLWLASFHRLDCLGISKLIGVYRTSVRTQL